MAEKTARIAILASGSGSTAEAFIRATQTDLIDAEVGLVISNNSRAGVFRRITKLNHSLGLDIETRHISGNTHPGGYEGPGVQTLSESEAIMVAFEAGGYDLLCLQGYMKKISGALIAELGFTAGMSTFAPRMLNTHPGLLPETAGLHGLEVQQYVIDNALHYAGQSLHVVASGYDTGPIVAEHRFAVGPQLHADSTGQALFDVVQQVEKHNIAADTQRYLQARTALVAAGDLY